MDVGCGAGTASLAYCIVNDINKSSEIRVNLIDRSKKQIVKAKELLRYIDANVNSVEIKEVNIADIQFEGLVMFSYVICEQKIDDIVKLLKQCKAILIIDYEDNIMKVTRMINQSDVQMIFVSTSISEGQGNVSGCFISRRCDKICI